MLVGENAGFGSAGASGFEPGLAARAAPSTAASVGALLLGEGASQHRRGERGAAGGGETGASPDGKLRNAEKTFWPSEEELSEWNFFFGLLMLISWGSVSGETRGREGWLMTMGKMVSPLNARPSAS